MMKKMCLNMPVEYLKGLEELVEKKKYPNVAEAIRVAVKDLLDSELWLVKK